MGLFWLGLIAGGAMVWAVCWLRAEVIYSDHGILAQGLVVLSNLLDLYDLRFELAAMEKKGVNVKKMLIEYGENKKEGWIQAREVVTYAQETGWLPKPKQ